MSVEAIQATTVPDTLDAALSGLEWAVDSAKQHELRLGQVQHRTHHSAGFAYVTSGAVKFLHNGSAGIEFRAGDLMFFPRSHSTTFVALEDSVVLGVDLQGSVQGQMAAELLPDFLYVRDFSGREPLMVGLVEGMGGAISRPGDSVICGRIATIVVSAALRAWNEAGCSTQLWLERVTDPYIASALDALHAEPARAWTVGELARTAAMSRTTFAARFRRVVGRTPHAYLTAVRMEQAKQLIQSGVLTISDIAASTGYASEDGFSRAFSRYSGITPGRWGRA